MRAVVFGGSGFIGAHLTASLVDRGYRVVVADLVPPQDLPTGASYEPCDVRRPIDLRRGKPYDAIYNLAAVHRTPGHEPHEYYETNVLGAQNVTNWAATGGGDYICFTSSISVYGRSEEATDETAPLAPNSNYGLSKMIAESIHSHWSHDSEGRRLVVVRPAVVFGYGENGNFTRLARALAGRRFAYPGSPSVIKACGYVGDLIRALEYVEASSPDSVTFNFCYPQTTTLHMICTAFNEVLGYRMPPMLPRHLVHTALRTMQNYGGRHGRIIAARVRKLIVSTNVKPSILNDLGYRWNGTLADGIREWQRSIGGAGLR